MKHEAQQNTYSAIVTTRRTINRCVTISIFAMSWKWHFYINIATVYCVDAHTAQTIQMADFFFSWTLNILLECVICLFAYTKCTMLYMYICCCCCYFWCLAYTSLYHTSMLYQLVFIYVPNDKKPHSITLVAKHEASIFLLLLTTVHCSYDAFIFFIRVFVIAGAGFSTFEFSIYTIGISYTIFACSSSQQLM